jgi:hypothetical protein
MPHHQCRQPFPQFFKKSIIPTIGFRSDYCIKLNHVFYTLLRPKAIVAMGQPAGLELYYPAVRLDGPAVPPGPCRPYKIEEILPVPHKSPYDQTRILKNPSCVAMEMLHDVPVHGLGEITREGAEELRGFLRIHKGLELHV